MEMQEFQELEEYRLRLYKWDKFFASIIPLVFLSIIAYLVEKNNLILFIGFGTSLLILYSIVAIDLKNFAIAKLIHFVSVYGIITLTSLIFPFMRYEYFLLPLVMMAVYSTYPFQNQYSNNAVGILCIATSIILFFVEINQTKVYPQFDFFSSAFSFMILYIAIVEIIIMVMMGNKYHQLIVQEKMKLKLQYTEMEKYLESNMQLENFAHIASHDLKTPLSNVIRFSQLLKYRISGKLNDKELELFDFIIDGSKHMNDTINSLFQFSLATNKKVEYSTFNVSTLLDELKSDIQVDLKDKGVTIEYRNLDHVISADRVLMKQLFFNLIMNGIKFIHKDMKPNIIISGKEEKDFWTYSIKDNGIGIEEEYLDSIFLIFKRLHDKSQFEGTGAGLAICKKIAEQHGGKIWVESTVNEGSTFHFSVKRAA